MLLLMRSNNLVSKKYSVTYSLWLCSAAPSPTIASILVNFMADLAEQKLSKKVTRKEPGNFYNGRYYWLGSRFYKGSVCYAFFLRVN